MTTQDFITTDDNTVAQLTSTISVKTFTHPDRLSLVRAPAHSGQQEAIITLSTQAEEALLHLLLARRGIKATPIARTDGAPRSYVQAFKDSSPKRYATTVTAEGFTVTADNSGRTVATATTPGWAAQLAAAWNAEVL